MAKKQWDMIRLFESVNKTNIPVKSILKENMDSRQFDIKQVVDSYLETALWADSDEDNADFEGKTINDVDPQSRVEAQADIEKFISIAQQQAPEELATYDASQLGHNIWLSRNGHSAGFFDDNNDKLQDIARNMKGKYMYVGDDQAVYIQE